MTPHRLGYIAGTHCTGSAMEESEVELGTSATQTEFREQSVQLQYIRSVVQGARECHLTSQMVRHT